MITLTFPDGAERQYAPGTTGRAIAEGIAKSLAKRTIAMALDGELADLDDPIARDARIEFVSRDDARALELIRHDAAHVLAEAVQTLHPGTQVTIGPVIENGFYYDFARNEPFTPDDFPAIEAKMREIIARDAPVHQGGVEPRGGEERVPRQGRAFQGGARRRDSRRREPEDLPAGRMVRPLPRAAHDLDRQGRQRLQAHEGGRRLLARRFAQPDADAHLRHRLAQRGRARRLCAPARGGREARPPPPRARDGPVPLPGGGAGRRLLAPEGLDPVPGARRLYAPAARRATTRRSTPRRFSTRRCGRPRAIGTGTGRTCSSPRPRTSASSPSSR